MILEQYYEDFNYKKEYDVNNFDYSDNKIKKANEKDPEDQFDEFVNQFDID